jgi:hypothetical protein
MHSSNPAFVPGPSLADPAHPRHIPVVLCKKRVLAFALLLALATWAREVGASNSDPAQASRTLSLADRISA